MAFKYGIISGEKGMALVLVLVFTGVLLIIGGAMINFALNEQLITNYQAQDFQKYYLAEAGLTAGLAALGQDYSCEGLFEGSLGGGTYQVTITASDPLTREITSSGSYEGCSCLLAIEVIRDPNGKLLITEWQRY
ncbi:MAG: hypothetical protein AVO34_03365 [Firmicutes bacterium ML8_F2]|jgi:hypothetical protein|nr:MAG: hypothetical protein AVO34_03365 [Firmicutes bacterium ML8_F2]